MTQIDNTPAEGMERFAVGDPLDYAIRGVSEIPSSDRRGHRTLTKPIREQYGTDVSDDTADIIKRLHSAVDGASLVRAVQKMGLDKVEDYSAVLSGCDLDDDEDADLGRVMQELDVKLHDAVASREKGAERVSRKKHRDSVYVPDLINNLGEGGTVYMAKTLGTTSKVRIAWDLHDENVVVVVNDYDKWEALLGWEKLKQFPHGKNKIREELGDRLSQDVLDTVAAQSSSSGTSDSDDTSSSGRRKRTPPTDEILNVAIGSRHRNRTKMKAEDIFDKFEEDGYIGSDYSPIQMLVLFPTTTDHNMTDNWWVPGDRWSDGGYCAIANCNKGTYEYLNQRDEVWHIEDYLEQAGDYEFDTNHGKVTLDTIDHSVTVLHVCSDKTRERLTRPKVFENLPSVLPEYADEEMYRSPDFPHSDDMLYAPITPEDVFWMRPVIKDWVDKEESDDGIVIKADVSPRDIGKTWSVSSDYKLYARARLPEWNFDSLEMSKLDSASYSFKLDEGGFEIVETLGKLHDAGLDPYSETPEARWS